MSSAPKSLKNFNKAVRDFTEELKRLFGSEDNDIQVIEAVIAMLKVTARLIITPFQKYVLANREFVRKITEEDMLFFLNFNYDTMVSKTSTYKEYGLGLISKFRDALKKFQSDAETVKGIFAWFKIMIYYAAEDLGLTIENIVANIDQENETSRQKGNSTL